MKSTGIVRQMDPLGRVVIPSEIRKTHGLKPKDSLEIFIDLDKIILRKHQISCIFCGSADNTMSYRGKQFCRKCFQQMTREVELNNEP
ncbi:MAG: AbrB/MazE/SpoVT family DNA-binding domain-containing protein [Firmicutes bacterium]|nr:AbrB/MazE/SpoVT family DNA-binding domain-containing protein [Bacillota bacterium]